MFKKIPLATVPLSSKELAITVTKILMGQMIKGKDVNRFEEDLAAYLAVDNVFAFNAGRTALYVALQALDLNPGEEVIVPAYTCPIVFEVILRLNLKPVLVDVNLETYNIEPELIPKALTPRTRAIVPVHLFGRPCDMERIAEVSGKFGLYTIEDAAQALGATFKAQKIGTFGDLAIFSFGPGKSITGGEGGAIAVNNPELAEPVSRIYAQLPSPSLKWAVHVVRNVIGMKTFSNPYMYALIQSYIEQTVEKTDEMIVDNCLALLEEAPVLHSTLLQAKMPSLSAAIASLQLKKLDEFNQKRIANANKLTTLLGGVNDRDFYLPKTDLTVRNTFSRYVVRIARRNRDFIINELLRHGIEAARPYHQILRLLGKLTTQKHLNAEELSSSLIALPNHPLLRTSEIQTIYTAFHSAASMKNNETSRTLSSKHSLIAETRPLKSC